MLSEKECLGGSGRGLELLKYVPCELDDLSFPGPKRYVVIPVLGRQRLAEPLGSLASKPA